MLEPTRADSKTYDELTNTEKAAIVLISLGRELSGQDMRSLPEEDVERITLAIARMQNINSDVELMVLKDYYDAVLAQDYIGEGGIGVGAGYPDALYLILVFYLSGLEHHWFGVDGLYPLGLESLGYQDFRLGAVYAQRLIGDTMLGHNSGYGVCQFA